TTVVDAPQPALQLARRGIKGGVEIARTCRGTEDLATDLGGDLDTLAVLVLPAVRFVEKFYVETNDLPVVTFEAGQFLRDVDPVVLGYLDVTALHDDVHTRPPS